MPPPGKRNTSRNPPTLPSTPSNQTRCSRSALPPSNPPKKNHRIRCQHHPWNRTSAAKANPPNKPTIPARHRASVGAGALPDGEHQRITKKQTKVKAERRISLAIAIAMASESHDQLHFVLIPLMSPGHLIPMSDMAKLFAQHGLVVTIITTPLNAVGIKPIIDRAIDSGLSLHLVQFSLPLAECGLPEGCENIYSVPATSLLWNFFDAVSRLQQPIEQLLETLKPSPSCIVSDKHLAWTAEIARKFGIPRYMFDGTSCFTLLSNHNIETSTLLESVSESEPFLVPGLPDEIELTLAQLPGHMNPATHDRRELHKKITESEVGACGVVVNSFEELEPEYVKEYTNVSKVWSIGPVSLCNDTQLDKAQRGNKASIDENQCLKWLDSWPDSSVVYVCLGSLSRVATLQLVELGLGLEASNQPFIWVVNRNRTEEWGKWLLEDGYEDRIKGRGMLIHGWAPQILILSHPAVGGFLTHCGWNSTLEAICSGIPMITWPLFAEQFYNEKLIVQVLKIGERVGANVVVPLGKQEGSLVTVKSGEFKEAIEKVMINEGNEEGEERRERAKKLAMMAKKATEEGGSSYLNIRLLIEDVRSYKHH